LFPLKFTLIFCSNAFLVFLSGFFSWLSIINIL
jgi:hypothetical protein